jgi:hypothetical protein
MGMDLESAATWIGLVFTAVTAWLAVTQYRRNSRRERALKAAEEMEHLHADKNVQLALQIADYGALSIQRSGPDSGARLHVNSEVLRSALTHHRIRVLELSRDADRKELFSADEWEIRDIFDGFLARLERIENLMQNGVIARKDFGDLFSYWLQLLGEWPKPGDTIAHFGDSRRRKLWQYIRGYEFNGVVRLFEKYGRAAPAGQPADVAFRPRVHSDGSAIGAPAEKALAPQDA